MAWYRRDAPAVDTKCPDDSNIMVWVPRATVSPVSAQSTPGGYARSDWGMLASEANVTLRANLFFGAISKCVQPAGLTLKWEWQKIHTWLVVGVEPLWKIWVRQLGWLFIPNISGKIKNGNQTTRLSLSIDVLFMFCGHRCLQKRGSRIKPTCRIGSTSNCNRLGSGEPKWLVL